MTAQQVSTVVYSLTAGGAIAEHAAVTRTATQAGAGVSDAGEAILGFADSAAAEGDAFKVNVGPTAIAVSGAAINGSEPRLKTAANGRLIPWTSGSIVAALLKPGQTASGAGEKIEVIPVVN